MYVVARGNGAAVENSTRKKHLAWVKAVMAVTGWDQTRLAREAGVHPSTLSRFLREANLGAKLGGETIEAIARLEILPPFETVARERPRGMAELEAQPYEAGGSAEAPAVDMLARAIAAARSGENALDPWVLGSRALEHAGCIPGDILLVDLNAHPISGDVVCAQVLTNPARPETVFRVYEAPFLVAASSDTTLFKPMLIDHAVHIRGVVRLSFRPQRARRAA